MSRGSTRGSVGVGSWQVVFQLSEQVRLTKLFLVANGDRRVWAAVIPNRVDVEGRDGEQEGCDHGVQIRNENGPQP